MKLLTRKIAVVLAHRQFNEREYDAVSAVLAREGARQRVVAASLHPAVSSSGRSVRPDLLLSDCTPAQFDALVFIGGNGARDYWSHPRAHNLVRNFHTNGRLLAAICVAPVILARAGVVHGRPASCHPSARRELEAAGAWYRTAPVTVDELILTASGPDAAELFADELVRVLAGAAAPAG